MIKIKTVLFNELNFVFENHDRNIEVLRSDHIIKEHSNFTIHSEDDIFIEIMGSKTVALQIILPSEEVSFDGMVYEGYDGRKIGFVESLVTAIKKQYNPS